MAKIITVTKEGLKSLQDELNERKGVKRAEIKEAIKCRPTVDLFSFVWYNAL